ncbi:hypothetical protein M378DRAFT_582875 [Amanita muscaria Koide BX008]|uniref:Uncharacterized protein n=1 Tax=Amanita muscaria (strain Koide BX008) TaxID=946122 RepID=A0A0C2X7D1_AMAMK|nr:hypothetical protein M378DRAFT_582875 [Amanita muscaria Koide BX008]
MIRASATTLLLILTLFVNLILASPNSTSFQDERRALMRRVDPQFPDTPPSCPTCAQNYGSINSCAQASTVLANFTMTLFNPGQFIDVIKCACTDTFQSTFPQCVDCFVQTNQTDVLNTPDLPSLLNNIRTACALASTVLSNKTTSSAIPGATQTSSAQIIRWHGISGVGGIVLLLGAFSSCF